MVNKLSPNAQQRVSSSVLSKFFSLFLLLFIDAMGMGILFPVLATAFMNPSSHFFLLASSPAWRTFDYGLIISVFMLCWFIGAGLLGEYSDHKGRKHCLIISLVGAALGYVLSALALSWHSMGLLLLGRVIAGLTAGSQSIAQAAIVDGSTEQDLPRNMGYVSLAICLGFVAGPIIGGIFADSELSSWFQLATPMFVAAGISIINLFLLLVYFSDTRSPVPEHKFDLLAAMKLFGKAFTVKKLRYLCVVFFVFIFGWSNYYSFISLYVVKVFHYTELKTAFFSVCVGLGFCLGSGVLNNYLLRFMNSKWIAAIGLQIAAGLCILTLITYNEVWLWIYAFIIGVVIAVVFPNIVSIFAWQVEADQQGWVMGVNGSIMALSFGLTTLFSGLSASWYDALPLLMGAGGLLMSSVMLAVRNDYKQC